MNNCKDINGNILMIGDYVKAGVESLNIEGYVCSINTTDTDSFISIKDENNEILMFDISSKYFRKYSKKERYFDEIIKSL